jgi:hypothetical protein
MMFVHECVCDGPVCVAALQITLAFKREAEVRAEQGQSASTTRDRDSGSMADRDRDRDVHTDVDEEEGSGSESESEVPTIVTEYVNTFPGGLGVTAKQIGLPGLRSELLRYESMLLEGLKRKGSSFHREGKRRWEQAVKTAETLEELRGCVVALEEVVRDTQQEEDEVDSKDTKDKREVMLSDGWIFDPLASVLGQAAGEGAQEQEQSGSEDPAASREKKGEGEGEDEGAGAGAGGLGESRRQYQELEGAAAAAERDLALYRAELEAGGPISKHKQGTLAKKAQKAEDAKQDFEEVCIMRVYIYMCV